MTLQQYNDLRAETERRRNNIAVSMINIGLMDTETDEIKISKNSPLIKTYKELTETIKKLDKEINN